MFLASALLIGASAGAGDFRLAPAQPTLDRWMYPFGFDAATRPVAPTYGSFDPRFDARDAQFLIGWDTADLLPTNAAPSRYLLRRARVTLTSIAPVAPNRPFVFDPTYDSALTYQTNLPGSIPDSDPGRPVEMYGVGFRNGFSADSYLENSPFGDLGPITSDNISIETRNAYAAAFDTNGVLVDISNHAAQLNAGWTNPPFVGMCETATTRTRSSSILASASTSICPCSSFGTTSTETPRSATWRNAITLLAYSAIEVRIRSPGRNGIA